jgi:hypothetical protein
MFLWIFLSKQFFRQQALACQALFTHTQEYANAWRSADVGMTWDFHIRAKREFEVNFANF